MLSMKRQAGLRHNERFYRKIDAVRTGVPAGK